MRKHRQPNAGFTLVESAISLGVFGVLLASVFSITAETSSFLEDVDDNVAVQLDGHRAFNRLMDLLRKSGRMEEGGVSYPRVVNGGEALEVRLGEDLDGNGYAFDDATGDLEWDARVFTIRTDDQNALGVYVGADLVYPMARHIQGLGFTTVTEDNSLHLKEIAVAFEARKETRSGDDVVFAVTGSVHMRN